MLLEDGTYFVIEGWQRARRVRRLEQARPALHRQRRQRGRRAAARSRHRAREGPRHVHARRLDAARARARISTCEDAAAGEGFTRLSLMATLPGVPLYKRVRLRNWSTKGSRSRCPTASRCRDDRPWRSRSRHTARSTSRLEHMDRWATFDCYGTLVDWNAGLAGRVRRCVAACPLPRDRAGRAGEDARSLVPRGDARERASGSASTPIPPRPCRAGPSSPTSTQNSRRRGRAGGGSRSSRTPTVT